MEHFPIVQALCRAALANASPASKKQVERLRSALEEAGDVDQAASIAAVLSGVDRTSQMTPSRLVRSAVVTGEELTKRTPLPVDREASSPLAEVRFPEDLPTAPPILPMEIQRGVEALIEEWNRYDVLADLGIAPSRSCLIYGAPGTGKTQLALWISRQLELPVVLARLDGLISSFLGTTSRNISSLFAFAERYRCVLLLDEFDAVAKLRDDPQEVGEIKRVVNTLLQSLDARKKAGFTIGITNPESLLDPAIWRRFETQLASPRPQFAARYEIARLYFSPMDAPRVLTAMTAWLTEGQTGAEVEMLVGSLRKRLALSQDQGISPHDAIRNVVSLHGGRIAGDRRMMLDGTPETLAGILLNSPDLKFDQRDVAEFFAKSRTTIGRWISSGSQQH